MLKMALFTVRSPFQSTAWLGDPDSYGADNPCQPFSDRYWHKSAHYQARAFDIAVASGGGGGTVYARLVNGTGLVAGVRARRVTYKDGWCGVDISASNSQGTRRLRYYHVIASSAIAAGEGSWVNIGTIPAYGSQDLLIGTVSTDSTTCGSKDGWFHVHVDTARSEAGKGSGGEYEWINCSLIRPDGVSTSISSSTTLFYL